MKIIDLLQNLNLSEREAKVYFANLEVGTNSVYQIAKKSGIPRSSVYEILDNLIIRGVVVKVEKKGVKIFTPIPPEKLFKQVKKNLKEAEVILPELKLMFGLSSIRPRVRVYEGKNGLIRTWEEILETSKKGKRLSAFTTLKMFKILPDYFPEFREKRVKAKIFARLILADTPEVRKFKKKEVEEYQKIKLIPAEYELSLSFNLCSNKTFITSYQKHIISVVIENREITNNFLKIFNFIWHSLDG